MKQQIIFDLLDGDSIMVEVDRPLQEGSVVPASRPGEVISKASKRFEEALEKIKPVAEALMNNLRGLSESPDGIKVEFGVKLSADAGAIIASSGVEANFKITLEWKRTGWGVKKRGEQ